VLKNLYLQLPVNDLFSTQNIKWKPLFTEVPGTWINADIWNGNTAIQVQPDSGGSTLIVRIQWRASAVLESVEVISLFCASIVALRWRTFRSKDSYIHDCAATGVFVGGNGSQADKKSRRRKWDLVITS
jgi:hypothetical protein